MNRLIAKVSRFIGKRSNFRIIFIIGTGRSGTHWIGYILQRHPNIYVSIEKSYIFYRVTSIALDSTKKNSLFPILTLAYRFEYALAAPLLYEKIPLASKCALRWRSHFEQMIPIPEIKRESLDRWRTELSDQTYAEIHKIVGDIHSDA